MASKAYVAVQVTLAAKDTNYHLLDLITEIDGNCPPTARELTIQAPKTNDDGVIKVGDAQLADGRVGYELGATDSRTYRSNLQNVLLGSIYVRGSDDGLKLNVEVMAA